MTRNYANYFKEFMNDDPETSKKGILMMPIADAPMTPLHEVSRKIPDYVRFGPILPKSAGFSLFESIRSGLPTTCSIKC